MFLLIFWSNVVPKLGQALGFLNALSDATAVLVDLATFVIDSMQLIVQEDTEHIVKNVSTCSADLLSDIAAVVAERNSSNNAAESMPPVFPHHPRFDTRAEWQLAKLALNAAEATYQQMHHFSESHGIASTVDWHIVYVYQPTEDEWNALVDISTLSSLRTLPTTSMLLPLHNVLCRAKCLPMAHTLSGRQKTFQG
ncbi:hypothetical protein PsorP6_011219 [Peronosclerospora sorghi]|uniref:Uncharacterized protein n=1 Tax=Peronosclerospora sorghi TaxID=230839 RepID=A0ACC0VXT9_9STRA|nr:hypothetical protein PsorP6_011219 [Peronosclerospora sorghi]